MVIWGGSDLLVHLNSVLSVDSSGLGSIVASTKGMTFCRCLTLAVVDGDGETEHTFGFWSSHCV